MLSAVRAMLGRGAVLPSVRGAASAAAQKATSPPRNAGAASSGASASSRGSGPVPGPHQAVYTHAPGPHPYVSLAPATNAGAGASAATAAWSQGSVRTGLPLLKCGMTCEYDAWGVRRTLTVLRAETPIVVGVATVETRGYTALAVGAGCAKHVNAPARGAALAAGLPRSVRPAVTHEFRVTPDALLPIGSALGVRHFVPGQFVNVRGKTQGKGFQGGMKRWGFAGQPASHGNSVSHRALGATGCRQDPGRVFKGKKMPGRMGGGTVTMQCLRVYKLDVARGLVFVEGAVPGKPGAYLRVTDAPKKPWSAAFQPPFPSSPPLPADAALVSAWAGLLPQTGGRPLPTPSGPLPPPFELVVAPPATDPFAIAENEEGEEV